MTPQDPKYMLAKALFRRAFQVAMVGATSLVARNQMQANECLALIYIGRF